ncbi:MAG: hypothetical protein CK429_34430 [Mycobacterium sp.]|uniref:hypothetical protein n=1 Tax=Mycobacterium sp. TaxID=1785 RepID=UPI000CC05EFD|nr:hypothetical protein [Mycobacterium sp.]PJE02618.1 MAG: hypothetical protein CK429_34430 [Mycobacterium sp.]PJE10710.1 MAG: hypothetical protein CK428_16195 [Mycobacterium sp.]PJE25361.1 MAG: hypothetical protein CK431_01390 [Mycobacterium sp.]
MSTSRQKRKAVFDPSALDDEMDEMWPARSSAAPSPTQTPIAPPATPAREVLPATPSPRPSTPVQAEQRQPHSAPLQLVAESEPGHQRAHTPVRPELEVDHQRLRPTASPGSGGAAKRVRPPEVLLSAEVYDELYRVQIGEKKLRRGLARPMGTIVMDAIEAHAPRLATTWSTVASSTMGEGQLFERPSSNAVPRRRRHVTAPRTVVLSGVSAANGQRLDNLVLAWGAGTRSALVEQALRYEFGLLGA